MNKLDLRERIQYALKERNISIYSIASSDAERVKLSRQINGDTQISADTTIRILSAIPDISADWLLRGEGSMERTKIVVPPTHRQDIHIAEGATAAISQSGEATVAPADSSTEPAQPTKREVFTPADIARMIKDNDLAGLVAIIFDQQQQLRELSDEYHTEIIRLQNQRNTDLIREMHMVDSKLFPEPK